MPFQINGEKIAGFAQRRNSPMDNLTAESAAVCLYAAWAGISHDKALQIFSIVCEMRDSFERVAAEHERICSERIAAAVKAARVGALREAIDIVHANSCGACRALGDNTRPLQALITDESMGDG
jgi:hypothetical protein